MTRDPSPVRWDAKFVTPRGPLQSLRESMPYVPPPEPPYVSPMRGNPLPLHSWAAICITALSVIGLVLWSLNHG